MTMPQIDLSQHTILYRWLTLASACGAAVASGISLWLNNFLWLQFTLIFLLFGAYCIVSLRQRIQAQNRFPYSDETHILQHVQEVSDLRDELEKHKNLEAELKRSKLAAESAAMAKSEFLATMSHEIRTPLNGIIPMLELLANSRLAPDQTEYLKTAHSSALQMKQIVDDILDYSKLEAQKLRLESTGLNIRDLVNSVVQMFQGQAEHKKVGLDVELGLSIRVALRGDPVRLRQVLSNMVGNAVKFTKRGRVSIRVMQIAETRQHVKLRFEIEDTGIGIQPEDAGRLFKPFSQADTTTSRLYGGTGLGLVICKRIIDLMNGQIGVNSQVGRGSTFWFEIPLLKAVGDSQGAASDLNNAKVLLMSSNPSFCARFEQSGSLSRAKLHIATSIFDAQRLLKESLTFSNVSDIDLLIIDVSSGRQSAIQLQKVVLAADEYAQIRVAMLHSSEAEPLELAQNPRRQIISRNMEMPSIIATLNKFLASVLIDARSSLSETQPTLQIEPASWQPMSDQPIGRVLLVEDNPVNLMVAMRLLQLSNFECMSAVNGQIALEVLQQQPFDLVLMDCQMPVMDGYEATKAWRKIEAERNLSHLPIIAMTANAMAEDRQKCLDAGMDDFISKPVDKNLLQRIMLDYLDKFQKSSQSTDMPSPPQEPNDPQRGQDLANPIEQSILSELREMMGSDFNKLIQIYLEDSPRLINQIMSAILNADSAALVNPAHTLKSASANLGALRLSQMAFGMEKCGKAGNTQIPVESAKQIMDEFEQVKTALNAVLSEQDKH